MFFVLEMIGTIAFAISGAFVGIQKKMDLFGVTILAMTTAVGGGIVRDIILDVTPPAAFRNPVFAFSAIATGIIVFWFAKHQVKVHKPEIYESILRITDAIGLGIFTVIGIEAAFIYGRGTNVFLAVFVGVATGVGGGLLRDIMAGSTPYIFTKHFYACASIIGAVFCALSWRHMDHVLAMLLGAGIIVVLRILAARYRWSLPRIE